MKTLKIVLDYGSFPIWIYDEKDKFTAARLPDELSEDKQLESLFRKVQKEFEAIYVKNEKEFYCKGFPSDKEAKAFHELVKLAIKLLEERCKNKFKVLNDLDY